MYFFVLYCAKEYRSVYLEFIIRNNRFKKIKYEQK